MKAYLPQIRVPGARMELNELGQAVWDMPEPIYTIKHRTRKRDKETGGVIHGFVNVPVYAGADASLARYVKAQHRRRMRKLDEVMRKQEQQKAALGVKLEHAAQENENAGL